MKGDRLARDSTSSSVALRISPRIPRPALAIPAPGIGRKLIPEFAASPTAPAIRGSSVDGTFPGVAGRFGSGGAGSPDNRLAVFGASICNPDQTARAISFPRVGTVIAHQFGLRKYPGSGMAYVVRNHRQSESASLRCTSRSNSRPPSFRSRSWPRCSIPRRRRARTKSDRRPFRRSARWA